MYLHCRWKGDYGDKMQRWFPANYTEEVLDAAGDQRRDSLTGENSLLGAQQKGAFDVSDCVVQEIAGGVNDRLHVFRLHSANASPVEIACETEEEMKRWIDAIREGVALSKERVRYKLLTAKFLAVQTIMLCRIV